MTNQEIHPWHHKKSSRIKFLAGILMVFTMFSCNTTLLFTSDQFPDLNSATSIPDAWHGTWQSPDSSISCVIAHDSLSFPDFSYKIIPSNMMLGLDSMDGTDKLIVDNNWCFLSIFTTIDTIVPSYNDLPAILNGYRIFIGNLDKTGNISCWEMSYDYFLQNGLIDAIPAYKYEYEGDKKYSNASILEKHVTYVVIPEGTNLKTYHKIVNQLYLAIDDGYPFLCTKTFDIDFFKKVALSRTPDLILTKDKSVISRKENKYEKKFRKIAAKNEIQDLLKKIKSEL